MLKNEIGNKIKLIPQDKNYGIAHALNILMMYAKEKGVPWVLTLDQDTEISTDSINKMFLHTKEEVGVICPVCRERGGHRPIKTDGETEFVEECITAGQLTSVEAWEAVGGYDERLFIDFVDFDFCWRLAEKDIKILRVNEAKMIQEVGQLKEIRFFNRFIYVRNHSPQRFYYITRNRIYCLKKLKNKKKYKKELIQLYSQTLKTLLFESDRIEKLHMLRKGIIDAKKL